MNILETLARNLVGAMDPLRMAFTDFTRFRSLMFRLGWNVKSLPLEYQNVANLVTEAKHSINSFVENPALPDVLDGLEKIKNAYSAIKDLSIAPEGVNAGAFLDDIDKRLFELLLAEYLALKVPTTYSALQMLAIIQSEYIKGDAERPGFIRNHFLFNDISEILKNPLNIPERVYGWGSADLNFELIASHLLELFTSLGMAAAFEVVKPHIRNNYEQVLSGKRIRPMNFQVRIPILDTFVRTLPIRVGLKILELPPGTDSPNAGLILEPDIPKLAEPDFQISENLSLHFRPGMDLESAVAIIFMPGELYIKYPFHSGTVLPPQGFGASIRNDLKTSSILLGSLGSSRVQYKGWEAGIGLDQDDEGLEFQLHLFVNQLEIILAVNDHDGFVGKLFGNKDLAILTELGIFWSQRKGLSLSGGAGFEVVSTPHLTLGPISIEQLRFGMRSQIDPSKSPDLIADAIVSFNTQLGPILIVLKDVGVSFRMVFAEGNAGPFDLSLGFNPPSGVGLSIDSGGIKGSGFLDFDPEKKEYFGAVELEFKDMFSMKGFGIINTRMPDGSDGFSLLIVITAEFNPIQLGLGFTLNGVGGLLGVNRTIKLEILKEGIKTNTLKSILFPENVVANISRIVSDIKQVFPPKNDHFLIAPMAKVGWGIPTIITLEMGLLIEIPATRLIILGVLKALLPKEEAPLLKLQVNFVGNIDFENRTISFDAWLYDSTLLTYTLTGQMALRIAWGDNPMFVLSVGGFHPAFKEIPAGLQNMQRITIGLLNTSKARITIQKYFALTSNTVQFGAKAELYASNGGSWNIYGFIGYDVLFQFDPFKFIADFYAGVALRRNQSVVMGISVSGTLAGPSPWDAKGKASISFFFFSVSIPFHETWGHRVEGDTTEKADLLNMLTGLIGDNRSWKADIPSNNNLHVSIREISQSEDALVIHPFGILTFSERLVPLEIDIDKFGNKIPKDAKHFTIKTTDPELKTEHVREQFAPANFIRMTDAEKLARPSFESMKSGFKITGSNSLSTPMVINKSVDYEFSYLGRKKLNRGIKDRYSYEKMLFKTNTKGAIISKSPLSNTNNRKSPNAPERIAIEEESFVLANVGDMSMYKEGLVAGSYTETMQYYNELVKKEPALKGQLQVLSHFELNTN